MNDSIIKELVRLLDSKKPVAIRRAAAPVLGEVGAKDKVVGDVLSTALGDPDQDVQALAVSALGKLGIDQALPALIKRVEQGGVEAEATAQAVAHMGSRGVRSLQQLMGKSSPGLRRRIASALAGGGTARSESAVIEALLDADPGVVDSAARSFIREVPDLSLQHRRTVADHLIDRLQAKSALSLHSEAALVRVLAALHDSRAQKVLWARVPVHHPPEIRAAALQALGTLAPPTDKAHLQLLLACATDADFRVAAPALMILKATPVTDRYLPDWLKLLTVSDPAVRVFAMDMLAAKNSAPVIRAVVGQLSHPDRSVRDKALPFLSESKPGRTALVQSLLDADTAEHAWNLARHQLRFAVDWPSSVVASVFSKACGHIESGDRRADPLLFVLREADAKAYATRLEERAVALRKKKDYTGAMTYFRLLARDPACGDPIRLHLATCGLKVSPQELAAEDREADSCLEQFAGILHRHEVDVLGWLVQSKWLEPKDLFYLGFHFVEGNREEKELGAAVLRHLIKKSPTSKLAKDAKNKLRSQGL